MFNYVFYVFFFKEFSLFFFKKTSPSSHRASFLFEIFVFFDIEAVKQMHTSRAVA